MNTWALQSGSNNRSISGRGDLSFEAILLRPHKSIKDLNDEAFFFEKKNPAPRVTTIDE